MSARRAIVLSRVLWATACFIVVGHGAYTTFGVGHGRWDWMISPWTPCVVFAICCAVSLARALAEHDDRAVWFVLASGLGFYAVGQAVVANGSGAPAPKLDRLGRSVTEVVGLAEKLHAANVGVHILTGTLEGRYSATGSGKFFFTVMAAFAELERDLIHELIYTHRSPVSDMRLRHAC